MAISSYVLPMITYFKKKGTVLGIFLFIVCLQLAVQFSSNFAYGADGYYYAAQVNSYVTKGRFFSPDSSPVLYGLVYFSKLGTNIITTNKVFVSLLVGVLFLSGYRLALLISKTISASILFGLLLVSSSFLPHFSFNFIKNLGGIIFFILFLTELWVLEKNEKKDNLITYIRLGFTFILVFFSHKITAGISLVFLLVWVWNQLPISKIYRLCILTSLPLSLLGLTLFFPNLLHWNDVKTIVSEELDFQFISPFYQYSKIFPEFVWEQILFFVSPFIYLLTRSSLDPKSKSFYDKSFVLFFLLTLPIFSYTAFSFPFRLFLLVFIPGCILLLPSLARIQSQAVVAILCIFLFLYQGFTLIRGKDFNNQDYKLYSILLPLFQFPKDSLIIVHQGFDYFICYHKAGDAFHFLPEEKHKDRPIYRMAYGVSAMEYQKYLPKEVKIQYLPGFYSVLEERNWQEFLKTLPAESKKRILDWKNPHTYRTNTMLRNDSFKDPSKKI
ncbi:hypothetical protein LEP1GSC195_1850 [Leptospira wolbachii serovar Codice str. CDC]|uniref:Dolichyl-phosphate-mannose-protein mannosyltransferase n=1 Tax=Leptospira wolbachii serovar Codice str. CDC TaxID=1218599 RepID=R9A628_9LEPT|nr:hypothetical protein [Leptospira wolbachii]EOQ95695.1 hypothetical protein LEP1GSC195_1850 [Leptospira wolbachii serovar Codice str. CDC]